MDYAETCYIITGICIVISIIFSALTKYIDNKNKKKHKEEVDKLQHTIDEILDEEPEEVKELVNETTKQSINEDTKVDEIGTLPYQRKMLLTSYEYKLYKLLKPLADKNNLHIMSKVRIIDFISVKRGMTKNEAYSYICKIKQSHIDFLICNPENLYPLAAIELDDNTHQSIKAQNRDKFKDEVFKSAGIKLYRVKSISEDLEKIMNEISTFNKKSNC